MKEKISKLIKQALTDQGVEFEGEIQLDRPKDERFGDWTANIAMVLAKKIGRNPVEIAKEIAEKIKTDEQIAKVEVVGGYINFYLTNVFLANSAGRTNDRGRFEADLSKYGQEKTVVIDYSAPNIAKPFGIGHLRSTNIGQALYNIYKMLGWKTIGDNHLGDWGTQFGKMITALIRAMAGDKRFDILGKPVGKIWELTIGDLEKLYVQFHVEADIDKKLIDEARDWFAKLEKGDAVARDIWQKCVDISLREFGRVYQLLGVKIDYALGESFYEKMLPEIVELFKTRGLVKESEGTWLVEFPNLASAILLKSDGATNYLTRDLATIKYRMETWNPDLIIYEVGSEQKLYFQQLFAAAEMVGWKPKEGYKHIGHGLIRWKDGKFSTRKGDTIHLADVIDTAMEQARKIAPNNSQEEIEAVAVGAIKFNDLASDPTKDVIFDWDKVMSMEGSSGPYLQYTLARCLSVLSKSAMDHELKPEVPGLIQDEELSLLRELSKFEEKVVEAAERFNPAVIAEHLLTAARKYNEFYAKHRVIGGDNEAWRLFLTKTTAETLKIGLGILGIKTLEKM